MVGSQHPDHAKNEQICCRERHHRAYAYLLIPERRSVTRDALKRLEAIESLEDLGAGFMLATHDLEIRGAGELLGDEQSGF